MILPLGMSVAATTTRTVSGLGAGVVPTGAVELIAAIPQKTAKRIAPPCRIVMTAESPLRKSFLSNFAVFHRRSQVTAPLGFCKRRQAP